VVICGGGRIGSAVVNLLTEAGKHVVVIDSHPDPTLIRRARESRIDLLTGDHQRRRARAVRRAARRTVVVLTNSDPGNLEIALGARALRADVPLVVRMETGRSPRRPRACSDLDLFAGRPERAGLRGPGRFPNPGGSATPVRSTRSSSAGAGSARCRRPRTRPALRVARPAA